MQVTYLPSVYDPKKIREGIKEILYVVENWRPEEESKKANKEETSA